MPDSLANSATICSRFVWSPPVQSEKTVRTVAPAGDGLAAADGAVLGAAADAATDGAVLGDGVAADDEHAAKRIAAAPNAKYRHRLLLGSGAPRVCMRPPPA